MIRCAYCHSEAKRYFMYHDKNRDVPIAICMKCYAPLTSPRWEPISKDEYLTEQLKSKL